MIGRESDGLFVRFGAGTVVIKGQVFENSITKEKIVGLNLMDAINFPSPLGEIDSSVNVEDLITDGKERVKLLFASVASVDNLIDQLKKLKKSMKLRDEAKI